MSQCSCVKLWYSLHVVTTIFHGTSVPECSRPWRSIRSGPRSLPQAISARYQGCQLRFTQYYILIIRPIYVRIWLVSLLINPHLCFTFRKIAVKHLYFKFNFYYEFSGYSLLIQLTFRQLNLGGYARPRAFLTIYGLRRWFLSCHNIFT